MVKPQYFNSAIPPVDDDRLEKIFGINVSTLRQEQELTKKTFAHMSGISRPFLDAIEHGTTDVRLSYVKRLADALSVEPAYLLMKHERERDPWSDDPGVS